MSKTTHMVSVVGELKNLIDPKTRHIGVTFNESEASQAYKKGLDEAYDTVKSIIDKHKAVFVMHMKGNES